MKTSIKYGNETDWFRLFDKVQETDSFTEKNVLMKALASTRNYDLLKL